MDTEAMKPHGEALLAYHNGNKAATVAIIRDDGWTTDLPASTFFRSAEELELERIALGLAHGHVLDVGAGAGIHSLFLQRKGLSVCAIDVAPEAIRVMRERGVVDVRQADVMSFSQGRFDTVIMMGHGIGVVEDIRGLDRFLQHIYLLLNPLGQILLTSLDVRANTYPENAGYQSRIAQLGRYVGEVNMRFRYGDDEGPFFGWLHVDSVTLAEHASLAGWQCEVILQQDDGNYLARLRQSPGEYIP